MDEQLLAVQQQLTLIIKSWKHVKHENIGDKVIFTVNQKEFAIFDKKVLIIPQFELQPLLFQNLLGFISKGEDPIIGRNQNLSLLHADFTSYIPLIEQSYRYIMFLNH